MTRKNQVYVCQWCGKIIKPVGQLMPRGYGWRGASFCALLCAERFAMSAIMDGYIPSERSRARASLLGTAIARPYWGKARKRRFAVVSPLDPLVDHDRKTTK
jgi:hypothetical protein